MPRYLLLAIPSGADTVVRYAWQINADEDWEYHLTPTATGMHGACLLAGETATTGFWARSSLKNATAKRIKCCRITQVAGVS